MINVGIIGCGKVAQTRHLPEYRENSKANISAVFDLDNNRAKKIAAQYKTVACDSYQDIINNPEIDAVSICVRNIDHCKITIDALNAGKHVLCEKPMAVTLEECIYMVETAKKNNRFLMIDQNQRLTSAHQKARELVISGTIGRILSFKTCFGHSGPESWTVDNKDVWFFDKNRSAFGVMADLGIHKTDLIQFLTGQKVSQVMACFDTLDKQAKNGKRIDVEDHAICIYRMSEGTVGTMTASWNYYGEEDNSTILYGTEGIMKIYSNPQYAIEIVDKNSNKILFDIDKIQTNQHQTNSGVIDLWIDCLEENRPPDISGESVLNAMQAIFAAIESATSGKLVTI